MAHIYLTFDFSTDEEKAQLARHRLDGWKQAFRLDKKLTYKFDRPSTGTGTAAPNNEASEAETKPATKEAGKQEKPAKGGRATKRKSPAGTKGKKAEEPAEEPTAAAAPSGPVKLLVRLAFSGHEKMTEDRWVKRIPTEEPFAEASPETVKQNDTSFSEVEGKFDSLE